MRASIQRKFGAAARQVILAGLFAATASATAGAQLSLTSAVGMALRSDPRMKMAQADVDKAKASVAEARDAFVPTLGANAGVGYGTGVPLGVPVIFSVQSQSLLYSFSQKDYLMAARAGLQSSLLALEDTQDKVTEDVALTYVNLDTAQRREAVLAEEYRFAARLITVVQERVDAGQDSQMEILRGRRTSHQVRLQHLQAQDDVANLEDHLSRLLGMPGNPFKTVSESIPPMPALSAMQPNSRSGSGVESAFADALSKQKKASGDLKYRYRPQAAFAMNYSRINTDFTDFTNYYPAFRNNKSNNAFSIGMQIQLPVFDRAHQDRANQAVADAIHARYLAEDARSQFLEGRLKLRHTNEELQARLDLATDERDIAAAELDAVTVRLNAPTGASDQPQTNPKDEMNARLQKCSREVDLLDAAAQFRQAEINLLRQTGQLNDWLRNSIAAPTSLSASPIAH